MSLFDQNGNEPAPNTDNNGNAGDESKFIEQYVGEGKKWTDAEGLAKGYHHADLHIKTLEEENRKLREDRDSRLALEELVKELRETSGVSNHESDERPNYEHQSNTPNDADIVNTIRQVLKQEQAQSQYQLNIESCVNELVKEYGSGYQSHLSARAAELGLSREAFDKMAGESPKAFLALVKGTRQVNHSNEAPPRSSINSASLSNKAGGKDWNYYKQMRKENPSKYYSGDTQKEMMDAIESGDLVPGN